ncbi:MAG: cytochrome C oxidase subunit IV family protein [Bacteroidia bacterium]|nr:cytochrome C oxidase subunit IV family protein [Bacteroidia bacterium]
MHFHDNYPEYEKMAIHGEEEGKKARRVLWNVFWVMLIVTIIELIVGFIAPSKGWTGTFGLKFFFITLTLVKAAGIVLYFMHLKHERTFFKYTILVPYSIFMLYTIFILLTEGTYSMNPRFRNKVDKLYYEQQEKLKNNEHHSENVEH